ncbi:hypothetical protein DB30_07106 [Enhygromyxa salina]|uniref:4-vinyl reductase 4VR domain-containing protein n=1 Tax=Enhygromyxa salina TaxID=215803 RepID=A0A0C2CWW0_9BACT|nr:hypothetical protein [Enhygromyxa salina]KIG14110.1 hypothetical protein DB30_07106 [Enhygromyxa salina]
MNTEKGEYYGAALNSFVLAFGESNSVVQKILADAGVDGIDPERWYDYDWSIAIYDRIAQEVGQAAVAEVGRAMIETAALPPGIDSVQAILMSLGAWFRLNARGPVGDIFCTIEGEHSATIVRTQRGSCALNIGIIAGGCARYGAQALIEHAAGECQDQGEATCTYHVSW